MSTSGMTWIVEHVREVSKSLSYLLNIFEVIADTADDAREIGMAPVDGIKTVAYSMDWRNPDKKATECQATTKKR